MHRDILSVTYYNQRKIIERLVLKSNYMSYPFLLLQLKQKLQFTGQKDSVEDFYKYKYD